MKICYFGIYNQAHARNKNIIKGLRKNGVEVIEVNDRTVGWKKYWNLYRAHRKVAGTYDLMIVGFPGQPIVPLAKLLTRKPVVFDAHVSLFDAAVVERKQAGAWSWRGRWAYLLDWFSCRLADAVLLDTEEHVKYFLSLFGLKRKKFIVVYHGCDDELFFPRARIRQDRKFVVEFHGYVTPLHGLEYVLEAFADPALRDAELWIIGGGQGYADIQKKAQALQMANVFFYPVMTPADLAEKISQADVGLGILGNTGRVDKVIPNKLYELIAMKIPVLTADSPAVKEQFTNAKDVYVCRKADSAAILQALLQLRDDGALRASIAEKAFQRMKENLVPEIVGKKFLADLKDKGLYGGTK